MQSHTITDFGNLHIGGPDSDPLKHTRLWVKNNNIFEFGVMLTNYVTNHV